MVFVAQSKAFGDFACSTGWSSASAIGGGTGQSISRFCMLSGSMVEGVLLHGIVFFIGVVYGVELFNVQSRASSDFAYLLFCGGGGTTDCKAVRVAGQGVRVVEVVLCGVQARWSGQAR